MDNSTKDTIGCLGPIAGLFLIIRLVSRLTSGPPSPPMSDAELNSLIAKHRSDERQRCVDNLRKAIPAMPKDMQQYAIEAIGKC